jgi:hypothetical protein
MGQVINHKYNGKEQAMNEFDVLVGKRINGLFIANDKWTLVFRDVAGCRYRFDTENDCCNSVWFNHVSGVNTIGQGNIFDLLRGAEVLAVESKGWTKDRDDEDGPDVVQDAFWTIRTNRGYIDIEVRNSHNGYYGGKVNYSGTTVGVLDDLEQITEDF